MVTYLLATVQASAGFLFEEVQSSLSVLRHGFRFAPNALQSTVSRGQDVVPMFSHPGALDDVHVFLLSDPSCTELCSSFA